MKKIYNIILCFVSLTLFLSSPVYSHTDGGIKQKKTKLTSLKLSPVALKNENHKDLVYHIKLRKNKDDHFDLAEVKVKNGKATHFFKPEYSSYMIEVCQNGECYFSGGFNNENVLRFELMDDSGSWQREEKVLDESVVNYRIPVKDSNYPADINIYKMGEQQ